MQNIINESCTLNTGVFQVTLTYRVQLDFPRGPDNPRIIPLRPLFVVLSFHSLPISHDLLDAVAVIELLRAFASNKLSKKTYSVRDLSVKYITHGDAPYLKIQYQDTSACLDKAECLIQQAQLNKIIAPCQPHEFTDIFPPSTDIS